MTRTNLDFETGSSILVNTPPSDRKRMSGHALLHVATDALVAVTYDQSADSFLRTWRRHTGTIPDFVRLIEVGGTMRSTAGESMADESMADDVLDKPARDVVETVERPNDLDTVRSAIASALAASDGETVLIFDSLTTPAEHVSLREMIPFFHAVSELLADTNAVGYFYCEERSDISAVTPFRALVDETVELDDTNDTAHSKNELAKAGPSLDIMFEVLSSRRRRDALRYLLDTEGAVDIDELTAAVARLGAGKEELTREQHRQYYATLYQLHLPKLDSAGLIKHDERKNRITVQDSARWAESFLALTEE